ncbi:HAMP domain-containing sensor histidine kinase [Aureisphaera galaxeae]|uniref:sensor histidine kinase n=1 Tax=Aureisphaera galaxeae TaxID=1538023 RepID=UPI0023509FF3|nr:HAMP domain-containing sensor histidine kinase [Aureisphaera galaxeae]MDC8005882.1 HAMP domain-containing sensor histidine kinase [Aureisphaera galaxeae]
MITQPIILKEPKGKLIHSNREKFKHLNTLPDAIFENMTTVAKHISNSAGAIIDLAHGHKNAIKSHRGIAFNGLEDELEFVCLWNNNPNQHVLVESAHKNKRFAKSTLLSRYGLKCLAVIPILDSSGTCLGELTICDIQQRLLTHEQENALSNFSKQITGLFEERLRNFEFQQIQTSLEKQNKNLEQFAGIVSHDLKTPLGQIVKLIELLENGIDNNDSSENQEYMQYLKATSLSLSSYIDEILTSCKKNNMKELIDVVELIESLQSMFKGDKTISINFRSGVDKIITHKAALKQILINLLSNAIKHNDKSRPIINITLENNVDYYLFRVQDNGPGIPKAYLETFPSTPNPATCNGKKLGIESGMGLTIFQELVLNLGGEIKVASKKGVGSIISFTVAKGHSGLT